jgi:hypothetical protein
MLTTACETSVIAKRTIDESVQLDQRLAQSDMNILPRQVLGPALNGKYPQGRNSGLLFRGISSSHRSGRKISVSTPNKFCSSVHAIAREVDCGTL